MFLNKTNSVSATSLKRCYSYSGYWHQIRESGSTNILLSLFHGVLWDRIENLSWDSSKLFWGWISTLLHKKYRVWRELGASLVLGICTFAVNLEPKSLLTLSRLWILGPKVHLCCQRGQDGFNVALETIEKIALFF